MYKIVTFKLWYCSHYSHLKGLSPVLHTNAFIKAWMSKVLCMLRNELAQVSSSLMVLLNLQVLMRLSEFISPATV